MTAVTAERGQLDVGRVVSQTFGAIARNPVAFALVTLLFCCVPEVVGQYLLKDFTADRAGWGGMFAANAAGMVVAAIALALCRTAFTPVVLADGRGEKAEVGACMTTALRLAPKALVVEFLFTLAVLGGSILLLIPGLIVMSRWVAAVPAMTAEGIGIRAAFSRSAALVESHLWAVFGSIFVVGALSLMGVLAILFAIGLALSDTTLSVVVAGLLLGVSNSLNGLASAVVYRELTALRAGAGPATVAEVFD